MTSIYFNDRLPLPTERKFKDSGQMIAPCTIARTGVMLYKASELGGLFKDKHPDDVVRIATFAEDLFDCESLESYRSSPVTLGHPDEDVTSENAKHLMKGCLEGVPTADMEGAQLAGHIMIHDADAIAHIKAGESELSSGHKAKLVINDSGEVHPQFGMWDAKKTNIRNNHIAIVKKGRAGNARIADSANEAIMEEKKQEEVIQKEIKVLDAADIQILLDASKDENANLKKEIQILKDSVVELNKKLSDEAFETKVNDSVRAKMEFVKEAAALIDAEIDFTKSEVDIKREILEATYNKNFKDRDENYINVRYNILKEEGAPARISDMQQEIKKMMDSDCSDNSCQGECEEKHLSKAEQARQRMINRHSSKK